VVSLVGILEGRLGVSDRLELRDEFELCEGEYVFREGAVKEDFVRVDNTGVDDLDGEGEIWSVDLRGVLQAKRELKQAAPCTAQ